MVLQRTITVLSRHTAAHLPRPVPKCEELPDIGQEPGTEQDSESEEDQLTRATFYVLPEKALPPHVQGHVQRTALPLPR